ncbi:ureidoglycolate lyase [Arcobacter arenosus]|uniref:Ureidoglycolate hydrolase n=1 Tax=Arcobacter arenosus TaxID=2576037 RepID=A0A5R8Y3V7_9BACT|nr:ureidoglycolate lyase [Arcobacter arenosus]TLP39551.1 ureidoglycolate hydrolase [Arcobacter arenosus]
MSLVLKPIDLASESFKDYGKVISVENTNSIIINDGFAQKHYNLCDMDATEKNGVSTLHIYIAKKREFPLVINMLEKHPYFSQTFMPRDNKPFLVVVALGDKKPDLSTLKVFKTNGNQGVFYKRGIWHFPLISIEDNEQFIVIDRNDLGKKENKLEDCIEINIDTKIEVLDK